MGLACGEGHTDSVGSIQLRILKKIKHWALFILPFILGDHKNERSEVNT